MDTQQSSATAPIQQLPPEAVLMQMVMNVFVSQAISVAAKLGLADLLAEKPQTVAALAAATGTHERALYRLLRALASAGVFAETGPKVFSLTPLAETLRRNTPNSLRDAAIFMGEDWHWRVYGDMLYSVQTGSTAWGHVHGTEVFDYFRQNPEQSEIFNRAMTNMSLHAVPAVVEAYDFSGFRKLVDIAGGHGLLLAGVLRANPNVRGILFDLPHVTEGANQILKEEEVADRVEISVGDFFESVPAGADAYMMKHIIHDWDDERSLKILRNIHRAISADGKVLIIETVIPAGNDPHLGKLADLEMLVSPGGVERTEEEFRELLAQAGFRLSHVVPTKSHLSIIEAVKA
ncbi:MAG TPA: methyltransferase [Pyrinomonadaceae bacterium]|nr:methyltransferase [Pyrinomonadaceae bacterium]